MSPPRTHARVIRRFHVTSRRLSSLPGNLRGILWMLVAGLFFTAMMTLIKLLGARLHVTEIILIRQIFMAMIVAPTIIAGLPGSLMTRHAHLHALRITCASIAMFAGFTAVVHLPLADATAISFSKTFFVTIFAILFLGETVGRHRWLATITGFIGVLVILRPDAGSGINLHAGLAVAAAAAAAVVMILIRKLSQFERPVTILTYQAVFVGVIMLPFAIANWKTPTPTEWGLLVIAGFVSWAGQMCNIRAFRAGEASAIAAFDYVRLLYAIAIGFLLFADLPGLHTLAGAALIVSAALYTVWREAYLGKKVTTQSGLRSDPP